MSPKPIKTFLTVTYQRSHCIRAVSRKGTWAGLALPRVQEAPGHLAVTGGKQNAGLLKLWQAVVPVVASLGYHLLYTDLAFFLIPPQIVLRLRKIFQLLNLKYVTEKGGF